MVTLAGEYYCRLLLLRSLVLAALPSLLATGVHVRARNGAGVSLNVGEGGKLRIVNGTKVRRPSSSYPYHALPTANVDEDMWLGCGASIISPTFGLSAAHCFGGGMAPCTGPAEISLWLGDIVLHEDFSITPISSGKSARVRAEVICHPKFDGKCSHGSDIVLLRLKDALPEWVTPVPLQLDGSADGAGGLTTDIGYGITESKSDPQLIEEQNSPGMRKVSLTILEGESESCKRVYSGGWGCSDEHSEGAAENLHEQLCAGSVGGKEADTCSGDSGSPMVSADGVQIGIVSYGGGPGERLKGAGRMCGDPSYPGVYSRVSAFKEFIEQHVNDLP
eukprot:TRINITY_DN72661_c0_g1_i1.p1 TRINITY_DN72661_c0_g1~~TRINITY_DN72661_c0_g1_i1.p1  ORF type:complete len:334 (+),score=65.39 TRINITY_DN72661_c0_g1_i1:72-1073(+)